MKQSTIALSRFRLRCHKMITPVAHSRCPHNRSFLDAIHLRMSWCPRALNCLPFATTRITWTFGPQHSIHDGFLALSKHQITNVWLDDTPLANVNHGVFTERCGRLVVLCMILNHLSTNSTLLIKWICPHAYESWDYSVESHKVKKKKKHTSTKVVARACKN